MQTLVRPTSSWVVVLALVLAAGCNDQVTEPTRRLEPDNEIRAGKALFNSVSVLEPLPGGGTNAFSSAFAINDLGQAVGQSSTNGGFTAAIWDNNTIPQDLGALPGHVSSVAFAISNDGRIIAGTSQDVTTSYAVRWLRSNGQWLIDPLPSGNGCVATAISYDGTAITGNCSPLAVVWVNGSRIILGPGSVNGVNSKGQAVGTNSTFTNAVRWTFLPGPVTETNLGNLGGLAAGQSINDAGDVTGWSQDANQVLHAFLWSPRRGTMVDLLPGTVASEGISINATGKIVGDMFPSTGHAAYYDGRKVLDLGFLPGYTGAVARGLNNNGQAVGYSFNNSQTRATKWILK